jgi:transglutaminase-like putative cysteine protease
MEISKWRLFTRNPATWPVLLLLICFFPSAALSGSPSFAIRPPPAWILPPPVIAENTIHPGEEGVGLKHLIYDYQIRVGSDSVDRYICRSTKVLSPAHLEVVSKLELEFEPSYQTLLIHYIRISRGSQRIDALRPKEIKVIQKESELDQQLFNGTLSAVVFVNDVRVGDIVEYAYSVNGLNPIFRGNYSSTFPLAMNEPAAMLRFRLLWPAGRAIHIKNHNSELQPEIRTHSEGTEYLWLRHDVPAITGEDKVPDWFEPNPSVQISEFGNWHQVVAWAMPLYAVDQRLSPELSRQIASWRDTLGQPGPRLIAALRFVQDEVRYLGIEMGPHSHLPHAPSVVFSRRFGDCKDKSFLLVAMLRALNIDAWPALVNTEIRHALDDYQPTPLAFNHVIVQARLGNRIYWVDPTISFQRGGLDQLHNPAYERALVVREGSSGLEKIALGAESESRTVINETYTALRFDAPALLEVATTYYGGNADGMRALLAEESVAELGRAYLNHYSQIDAAVTSEGVPKISDDQNANALTITEKYSIPDFWDNRSRHFVSDAIRKKLARPVVLRRLMPLAIPYPLNVTTIAQVHLPKALFHPDDDSGRIDNTYMQLEYNYAFNRDTLKLQYHLRTLQDNVPVEQVAGYLKDLDRMRDAIQFDISPQDPSEAEGGTGVKAILGIFLFGGLILLIAKAGRKYRSKADRSLNTKKTERAAAGTAPETAIRVANGAAMANHLKALSCECGNALHKDDRAVQKEMATFDGRRLVIIHLQCDNCARTQAMYFEVTAQ